MKELDLDHSPIQFFINKCDYTLETKINLKGNEVKWDLFKSKPNKNIIIHAKLHSKGDVDNAVKELTQRIQQTIHETIPSQTIKHNADKLPKTNVPKIKMRNSCRKKYL